MERILEILNFYSLNKAISYMKEGGDLLPLHHIWCFDYLQDHGYKVLFIEPTKKGFLGKIGERLHINNLQQQITAIKRSKEYDIIFDPFMQFTFIIAILKLLGLFKKPIIAIAQRSYIINKKNPIKRARQYLVRYILFKGIDKVIFINKPVADESDKYPIKGNTDYLRSWGVETEFFQSFAKSQPAPTEDYIYSTGGSARDFDTLVKAFHDIDFKLRITARNDLFKKLKYEITPNIVIDNSIPPSLTSTGQLRKEYYNALAVAIPIERHSYFFSPYGNTVLFEAWASGRPVIATDNKAFPFNIEKEKVGFLIEYEDVEGWKQAINYLIEHPEEAREMGERGLHLCKTRYEYSLFSKEVLDHISTLSRKKIKNKTLIGA